MIKSSVKWKGKALNYNMLMTYKQDWQPTFNYSICNEDYRIIWDNDEEEMLLCVYKLYRDFSFAPTTSAETATCTCCNMFFGLIKKKEKSDDH